MAASLPSEPTGGLVTAFHPFGIGVAVGCTGVTVAFAFEETDPHAASRTIYANSSVVNHARATNRICAPCALRHPMLRSFNFHFTPPVATPVCGLLSRES